MMTGANHQRQVPARRPCALFVAIRSFALANSRLLIMNRLQALGWRVVAAGNADQHVDRLTVRVAQHRPGDVMDVEILRGEERKKLSVTLGRWPDGR